ncbi:MAG TPA: hypothetical protein VF841_13865 [Anaeromyxobacter sp.]
MTGRPALLAFVVATASACVAARPGAPLAGVNTGPLSSLIGVVSFDHGCPAERVRVIRVGPFDGYGGVDVDVCGVVRRYKATGGLTGGFVTWLDATSLYPPSALPPPLPATP